MLAKDERGGIAANIAKLPQLVLLEKGFSR
jgi:hypothetical protein